VSQVDVGDKIRLGRVLALKQGDSFTVGKPYLENVAVEAEVLEELRGPKVRLFYNGLNVNVCVVVIGWYMGVWQWRQRCWRSCAGQRCG
jgi:hypothetical protein